MATIRDVARISGYSISTVSRVLNNKNYVSAPVRARIEAVMADLHYVPNAVARDLSRGKTMNIGVVQLNVPHPYYTDLGAGILTAAFAAGYNILQLPSHYTDEQDRHYLEQLRRKAYDGLIFTTHNLPLAAMLPYQEYGPIVVCHDPGSVDIAAAYSERGPAYQQAFAWIKARNDGPVGLLLPRDAALSATSRETLTAYQDVFGGAPDARLCHYQVTTYADGYAAAATDLTKSVQPAFVMANGDDIAAGYAQCYRDRGLIPPALMGADRQLSGQLLGIPTIDHHYRDVGAAALQLAIGAATGQVGIPADFMPERGVPRETK